MAISKLNSFFTRHHRIIFGVFAVLIILAFVFADWIGGGGGSFFGRTPANETAAVILGEKVTNQQLNDQLQQLQLSGRRIQQEQAKTQALQMTALDIVAKRNKITVSEDEVNKAIVDMFRNEKGEFQEAVYRRYIDKQLKEQGFTEDDFIAAVRSDLIRQKLLTQIASTIEVTDSEVKSFYYMQNFQIEAISTSVKTADFVKQVKVAEKALQEFFSANRKNYMIPAKLSAAVVKFSPEDHIKQVTVTEEELKAYYEANKAALEPVKGKDGKDAAPTFAQAKAKIAKDLKYNKALEAAAKAANDFSKDAYDAVKDQNDGKKVFAEFAAGKKMNVIATGIFSADAAKAGNIGNEVLVQSLTAVAATDTWLSEVIFDGKDCYVGYLTEYVAPRQAEYKEVAAKVRNDFIQAEATKLAQKRAEEIVNKLKALDAAKRIEQAKSKNKFAAVPAFSMMSLQNQQFMMQCAMQGQVDRDALIRQYEAIKQQELLFTLAKGEITPAIPSMDGFTIYIVTGHKAPEKPYVASKEFTEACKAEKANLAMAAMINFCNSNTQVMGNAEEQKQAE